MTAEKMPLGKPHGACKSPRREDHPSLGWHDFFRSLASDRSPERRLALPRGIQE
ncbi:hypothetical protein [Paenirhodobacter enshiensis]|uniref:hypothetical protein n=1 Tax=Paenirhodobacter enshiensis TaxID=1105367 RepID=UPI001377A967|nr:hypothetical protein [Paenirhodobacter enshiensis]